MQRAGVGLILLISGGMRYQEVVIRTEAVIHPLLQFLVMNEHQPGRPCLGY